MAHRLPAQRRNLRFGDIARAVRIAEDEVELLVMKAVANRLIDARIDEPARMVNVSWVQPRVLSAQQVTKNIFFIVLFLKIARICYENIFRSDQGFGGSDGQMARHNRMPSGGTSN